MNDKYSIATTYHTFHIPSHPQFPTYSRWVIFCTLGATSSGYFVTTINLTTIQRKIQLILDIIIIIISILIICIITSNSKKRKSNSSNARTTINSGVGDNVPGCCRCCCRCRWRVTILLLLLMYYYVLLLLRTTTTAMHYYYTLLLRTTATHYTLPLQTTARHYCYALPLHTPYHVLHTTTITTT